MFFDELCLVSSGPFHKIFLRGLFLLRPDAPFLPTAVSGFKKTFLYHLCQDAPTHSWHYFDILNLVYFYYDFIIFVLPKQQ